MKIPIVALLLFVLAGCGGSTAKKVVGEWSSQTEENVAVSIHQDGKLSLKNREFAPHTEARWEIEGGKMVWILDPAESALTTMIFRIAHVDDHVLKLVLESAGGTPIPDGETDVWIKKN